MQDKLISAAPADIFKNIEKLMIISENTRRYFMMKENSCYFNKTMETSHSRSTGYMVQTMSLFLFLILSVLFIKHFYKTVKGCTNVLHSKQQKSEHFHADNLFSVVFCWFSVVFWGLC